MEQFIDYSIQSDLPKMLGTIFVCAWCSRVKKPGSDPRNPRSWKVVPGSDVLQSGIFFSHGICPNCKAKVAA